MLWPLRLEANKSGSTVAEHSPTRLSVDGENLAAAGISIDECKFASMYSRGLNIYVPLLLWYLFVEVGTGDKNLLGTHTH
jgi:hypothetical protein